MQVVALLDHTTLLTLAGPGGVGETRFASEVAAREEPEFADGVWFVELGGIRDSPLVPQAAATVLGVHEDRARPVVDTLRSMVAAKQAATIGCVVRTCDRASTVICFVAAARPAVEVWVSKAALLKWVAPPKPFQRAIGTSASIPASSATTAMSSVSGQVVSSVPSAVVAVQP